MQHCRLLSGKSTLGMTLIHHLLFTCLKMSAHPIREQKEGHMMEVANHTKPTTNTTSLKLTVSKPPKGRREILKETFSGFLGIRDWQKSTSVYEQVGNPKELGWCQIPVLIHLSL